MSKKTPDLAEFQHVSEFAAASPALQLAIVAAIGDADPVTLYPAKNATLPGFDRIEQTVDRATAARVLAYLPHWAAARRTTTTTGVRDGLGRVSKARVTRSDSGAPGEVM